MTKRDFALIAAIIREVPDHTAKWWFVIECCRRFRKLNPRFDTHRFVAACMEVTESYNRN